MTESNSTFLRLITSVSKFIKGSDVLFSMPAMVDSSTELDTIGTKMVECSDFIDADNRPFMVAVEAATARVTAPLYAVVKAMVVYYTRQGDAAKVAELHVTRSEIQRSTYKVVESTVRSVLKFAKDNLEKLAPYGIGEASIAAVEDGMAQLLLASNALEANAEAKAQKRLELAALVEEGKRVLGDCDMVAEIVSLTHPAVFRGYQEVRSRRDSTELLFTITVLNSETQEPEENARVRVISTTRKVKNGPYVLLDRKTGKSGEVRNNRREFDIYQMTIEKVGCETHVEVFTVADNTPLRLEVMLRKRENLN